MTRDPRVDDYIAKAAPFARPILERVRERVHAVLPAAEEAIKWGMPSFVSGGKILLNMAAFKAHAAVNFWSSDGPEGDREGMGQLGKLATVADLPDDLDQRIADTAARRAEPTPPKPKKPPRPMPEPHPAFTAALAADPKASAQFDAFPPSHRRDYLEWIGEAKQDATRLRRIETTIEWLREGKSRNWKYAR